MEFSEEELENVRAGYSATDQYEQMADMLYNKALILNETMGKGAMTTPLPKETEEELNKMGLRFSHEEAMIINAHLCSRIELFNNQLGRGR